jgi:hypothetical protein
MLAVKIIALWVLLSLSGHLCQGDRLNGSAKLPGRYADDLLLIAA